MKKIVVAVDFSPGSDVAVKQAMRIARHVGAEICLLHAGVVPEAPGGVPEGMASTAAAYTQIVKEHLSRDRQALEELRKRISGQGCEVSHMVTDGFADTAIVRVAAEMGADLVAIGTHGRTGLKRFLLGSIAERVVRLADCSVLVARRGDDGDGGYRRLLVATDFSASARRALATALTLAAPGATVDLLHCWQLPAVTGSVYAPTKAAQELDEAMRKNLAAAVAAAGKRLIEEMQDGRASLAFHAVESPANHGIQAWLEEHHYDLVVTGSHGRRGVRRFLLGSVAEATVRHSPCSVLVVHGGGIDDRSKPADR